jgi:DNA polymerase-3 subunit alpha
MIKIPSLVRKVKKRGMSSIAITDHGNMHGVIDLYRECKKEDVHPIIGCEVYITEDEDGIEDNQDKTKDNMHCVLLAKNNEGLSNLYWLCNQASLNNFYYKPRVSIHNLKTKRRENLIATSACLGGIIAHKGVFNEEDKSFKDPDGEALKIMRLFRDLFGKNFYAEIQDNPEMWRQTAYNEWLIETARKEEIPLVITADAHFLSKKDKSLHNIVMAQQMKMTLEEYDRKEECVGCYIRSPDEMLQAAKRCRAEEAFWNTEKIARQCNVEIKLGEYQTPFFDITKEKDFDEFLKWKESNDNSRQNC